MSFADIFLPVIACLFILLAVSHSYFLFLIYGVPVLLVLLSIVYNISFFICIILFSPSFLNLFLCNFNNNLGEKRETHVFCKTCVPFSFIRKKKNKIQYLKAKGNKVIVFSICLGLECVGGGVHFPQVLSSSQQRTERQRHNSKAGGKFYLNLLRGRSQPESRRTKAGCSP